MIGIVVEYSFDGLFQQLVELLVGDEGLPIFRSLFADVIYRP